MHILFLTDNFPPEVNAPASRTFEHCREWVRLGHSVTVITCAPNFPQGRVFEGYRNRLWSRETMAGIEVIRVWTYITANEGFLKRTLDYVSFFVAAVPASLFVRDVDIIVGTSPQLFTACAACAAGFIKRRPYVFELRDLWPESIRAVGAMQASFVLDRLEALELFLYRRAAHIVSVTNAFRRNLVGRGIPAEKISITMNGADLARFQPRPRDEELAAELGLQGKVVVGYVGTHGMAHALGTILRAAERLQARAEAKEIHFLFLGDGAQKKALISEAAERKLANVFFVDSVPREDVVRYWTLVDISIIHLKRTELFETVIPSKLFECMAMGIPILHGVAGESAELVTRENVGLVFEPEDDAALANHIIKLAHDPALRRQLSQGCIAASRAYDRTALAQEMLETLKRTCGQTVAHPAGAMSARHP
ncbi:glycosyltransferase family 4 protein [Blastochloris sulfoviridis]|uniref:Glycosyltransferase family 4 protein n=1 Tax=Blastochloris sulfoviridis TaxID=50712 RepID=A0A5M6I3V5_9HYPH|nr:glycosyltransferase family 4 protein [Blastochloris sulfoviridis]KAA5602529.1 glycosyltransferase family 4 protein [Blastochloris sulfoviridis]